jgi:adenylosuccinate synthase
MALMMMDVLGHFERIEVCVAYELDGQRVDRFPCRADDLRRCKPIYETLPGWNSDLTGMRSLGDFPEAARDYVRRIETLVGVPIDIVSVGPDREQTIFVRQ